MRISVVPDALWICGFCFQDGSDPMGQSCVDDQVVIPTATMRRGKVLLGWL